jgi:hypothetical protein
MTSLRTLLYQGFFMRQAVGYMIMYPTAGQINPHNYLCGLTLIQGYPRSVVKNI